MSGENIRYIEQARSPKLPSFLLGGSAVIALGTAAFLTFGTDWLPDVGLPTENISTGGGTVEEVYVTAPSTELYKTYQTGWARVEDDSPAFLANPFAEENAINQIKVMYKADTMRVFERYDEQIGAYAYVAFYDESGDEVSLSPNNIFMRPTAPEPCILTTAPDGSLAMDLCTDEDSPDYRGARDLKVDSGGNVNSDTSMLEKLAPYADIFRINDSCINGLMLGGVYEGAAQQSDGPNLSLMQQRKLGELRSHYRQNIARQLDLPISAVLFKEDVEYLTRDTNAFTVDIGDGLDYQVIGNMFRPVPPKSTDEVTGWISAIDLDDPIAVDILELRDQIDDVKLPEGLNRDATLAEARQHVVNTNCYPGSDISKAEFEQLLSNINNFGAVCVRQGLHYDGVQDLAWAEERLEALDERVGNRLGKKISSSSERNCGDTVRIIETAPSTTVDNRSALINSGAGS